MRILTVIPISRGIGKDTLTYFTSQDISVGSIVSIPLRNKIVFGLVIGIADAQTAKSEIKTLTYNIRKIDQVETHAFLSPAFIESSKRIADYFASSVGSVLSSLVPQAVLEASSDLTYLPGPTPKDIPAETVLLQSDDEERYATYKSLIREEFARNRSVFFCMPTTEDLITAEKTLEKGIETYTYILHARLSKKEVVELWKTILAETHPVLIIATGSFLALPRDDIGTIILEKESSRAYKMQSRPFLDIRTACEIIAKQSGRRLVLGDRLLRVETLWEGKNGTYAELSPLKFRSLTTAECKLVSMRTPEDMKKKEFAILSEELKDILSLTQENSEHTFLFTGRKGLYPATVCSDCGTTVICKNCSAPVVLYGRKNAQGDKQNLFVCHHCGERRDAGELCAYCKGWRLNPLGIGTERVIEEIQTLLPNTPIFIMDKEHVTTHSRAVKLRDTFYDTPGSILVGTEMALTYLNQKVENTGVISLDSFFSIPDFRIHEKIFHILLALRALSERRMLVQTRQEKTRIFDYALRGNLVDFYRDEIDERKQVGYPPFTTYVKLTLEGEKNAIKKEMAGIQEFMSPFEMTVFDAFNPGSQKKYSVHGLIALPKGSWVDKSLLAKIRSLPPYCAIKIDPDTLL